MYKINIVSSLIIALRGKVPTVVYFILFYF